MKRALDSQRGALTIRGLRKSYGSVVAVGDLDLDLAAGEFITLLGPSGSGKTTTLTLVAGFQRPDAGQLLLDGRDITRLHSSKRNIGLVFQNYALFPHMTVAENIAYPLRMRGTAKGETAGRVMDALKLVRLSGLGDRYPRQLSGGQQQRVAVARATVYRPTVLLMDEPLSALDRSLREELQNEIRRIHRDLGTSVLYVTHDQEEALALSDRVVLMNEGRPVQIGTPKEIYEHPTSVFAASFVGQSNFLKATAVELARDGLFAVRLSTGGIVRGKSSDNLRSGQSVVAMIRPECITSRTVSGEDFGEIGCEINDVVYMGKGCRCRGTFQTGDPCILEVSSEEGSLLAERRVTTVRWASAKCVILPTAD